MRRHVYPMLEQEIEKRGLKKKDMASVLGITSKTFYLKANGGSRFTLDEAKAIQKNFFPACSLDVLFWERM